MSLSPDEAYKLEMIFEGARENPSALNDFETGFVSSTEERYNTYRDNTFLSQKQWSILDRIYETIVGNR